MKRSLPTLLVSLCALLAGASPAAAQEGGKTVVLVHGAFADGSSWDKVIPLLQAKGLRVVAVQNPLTSLADDVAATKRAIDASPGPVVLVGHSWGGVVITEAGNDDKVTALVYVAAFAPDDGQSVADAAKDTPPPPGRASIKPDAVGFLSLTPEGMAKDFAFDVPAAQTKIMAVTQGPVNSKCFGEKVTTAAWKKKPSWYIVADKDRMIDPEQQKSMAQRIKAKTTVVPSSHVVMLSHPADVANVIEEAANGR